MGVLTVYAAEEASEQKPAQKAESKTDETAAKGTTVQFKTEMDKVNYIIGTQVGQGLKRQKVDVNLDLLIQGIKDALAGKELVLSRQEMQQTMANFQRTLREQQRMQAEKNLAEGKAFLEANEKKEGVKTTASGLQYKVIKEGTGKTPKRTDRVKTHYRGTLINGEEFDSSYKRNQPSEFSVGGVIKGWTEALMMMKEGAKWQLFIPAELAYGAAGRSNIPPNSVLIFEIELLEIISKDQPKPILKPEN